MPGVFQLVVVAVDANIRKAKGSEPSGVGVQIAVFEAHTASAEESSRRRDDLSCLVREVSLEACRGYLRSLGWVGSWGRGSHLVGRVQGHTTVWGHEELDLGQVDEVSRLHNVGR